MEEYKPKVIEEKWQKRWEESKIFEVEEDKNKKKFFLTVAWPYPSGAMHVGHARTYTLPDVIARFKRMKGYNVLFPMGFHLTGSPIVGACERIKNNDTNFIKVLKEKYGVTEEELERIKEPKEYGNYFINESRVGYKKGMLALGYSIDWSRECTSIDEPFKKMVEWQYRKLKEMNLIGIGSHPVKFCIKDNNAVTDHDLLEGEGVAIVKFTIIKYISDDKKVFPAATLRPETIFGVTNIWLNPEADYVEGKLGDEIWVVSKPAFEKLRYQDKNIEFIKETKGKEYLGKEVKVPIIEKNVPILPATFVDIDTATGVVGSVPAHAPYDYVALKELQALGDERAKKIEPIRIISMPDGTSISIVEQMKIRDQKDKRKLDEATATLYKYEFAKGIMEIGENYKWDKMMVSKAKGEVEKELIERKLGTNMYEFSEKPVICRCGSKCIVKTVKDQWFLKYSDQKWKESVRANLKKMNIIPQESLAYFQNVVDWLEEWPCARKVGMGTKIPWDNSWVIESLSDSTIYMAYYTLAKFIKKISLDKLNDKFFEQIFFDSGEKDKMIEKLSNEFKYWYPMDYRISANELIPNHLTFMIYHHAALFPDLVPLGIVSLGVGVLEGKRMSSSRGIVFAVSDAIEKFGADVTRFYLMYMCEPWQDFDWKGAHASAVRRQIEKFYSSSLALIEMKKSKSSKIDLWLRSRIQYHIKNVNEALEKFQTRRALQHAFYLIQQDLRWYEQRGGCNKELLLEILDIRIRLLAPFIPHVCEELWERLGKKSFVSLAEYPEFNEKEYSLEAEFEEELIDNVYSDVREILRITKIKPKKIIIYTAQEWKRNVFFKAISLAKKDTLYMSKLMKEVKNEIDEKNLKELQNYAQKLVAEINKMPEEIIKKYGIGVNEFESLSKAEEFFESEFNSDVIIYSSDDETSYDPQNKKKLSMPFRPSIYVEG
ncbi:MAG: leucine--tRNA ligase [Candidatus Thermoplasmatota archaeon]